MRYRPHPNVPAFWLSEIAKYICMRQFIFRGSVKLTRSDNSPFIPMNAADPIPVDICRSAFPRSISNTQPVLLHVAIGMLPCIPTLHMPHPKESCAVPVTLKLQSRNVFSHGSNPATKDVPETPPPGVYSFPGVGAFPSGSTEPPDPPIAPVTDANILPLNIRCFALPWQQTMTHPSAPTLPLTNPGNGPMAKGIFGNKGLVVFMHPFAGKNLKTIASTSKGALKCADDGPCPPLPHRTVTGAGTSLHLSARIEEIYRVVASVPIQIPISTVKSCWIEPLEPSLHRIVCPRAIEVQKAFAVEFAAGEEVGVADARGRLRGGVSRVECRRNAVWCISASLCYSAPVLSVSK